MLPCDVGGRRPFVGIHIGLEAGEPTDSELFRSSAEIRRILDRLVSERQHRQRLTTARRPCMRRSLFTFIEEFERCASPRRESPAMRAAGRQAFP